MAISILSFFLSFFLSFIQSNTFCVSFVKVKGIQLNYLIKSRKVKTFPTLERFSEFQMSLKIVGTLEALPLHTFSLVE
jgi:hypothetical protein